MPRRLSSLLDREQDRIAAAWAGALSRMRPSAYVYRPLEELRRLGRAYVTELVGYIDSEDPTRLREFVHREAALRLGMGFGSAEVVQGFLIFRALVQDLCNDLTPERGDRLVLARTLAEVTDFSVVEFIAYYQRLCDERAAAQAREADSLKQSLVEHAVSDEATDLLTSRFFEEHLSVEVKRAARYGRAFSLMVVDIDGYDAYGDRYGGQMAAALLGQIGERLRDITRDLDAKARTGEAEFAVALPETGLEAAHVVAERVRSAVEEMILPHDPGGSARGEITASIGIGTHPDHGQTARELHYTVRGARDRARMLGGNTVAVAEREE